jgi:hypothetical protein
MKSRAAEWAAGIGALRVHHRRMHTPEASSFLRVIDLFHFVGERGAGGADM